MLEAINPLQPDTIRPDPALDGIDAELSVGDEASLNAWEVRIDADSTVLAAQVRSSSNELGFRDLGVNIGVQEGDTLLYAGIPALARQVLRWRLKKLGLKVKEVRQTAWADSDDDIWLTLRDPAQAGKPMIERSRCAVRAPTTRPGREADRLAEGGRLPHPAAGDIERGRGDGQAGTTSHRPVCGGPRRRAGPAHRADAGSYRRGPDGHHEVSAAACRPAATATATRSSCPWRRAAGGSRHTAGRSRAFRHPHPHRRRARGRPAAAGRRRRRLPAHVEAVEGDADDLNRGYAIHWGAAAREPEIASRLRGCVEDEMRKLGPARRSSWPPRSSSPTEDPDVWVDFPMVGVDDGSLLVRLSNPAAYAIDAAHPRPGRDGTTCWRLAVVGLPRMHHGDRAEVPAPAAGVRRRPGVLLGAAARTLRGLQRAERDTAEALDDDGEPAIWVYLPRSPATQKPGGSRRGTTEAFDLRSWFVAGLEPPRRRLRLVRGGRRPTGCGVANVWLPRRAAVRRALRPRPGGVRPLLPGRPDRRDAGPPRRWRGPARAVPAGGRDEHVQDQHASSTWRPCCASRWSASTSTARPTPASWWGATSPHAADDRVTGSR